MYIRILYDNRTATEDMTAGWGLSCLVNDSVLFDTGEDAGKLLANMRQLGVDPGNVRAVVISHDHWDHTGGLSAVLAENPGISVYICPGLDGSLKSQIRQNGGEPVEVAHPLMLTDNIVITGSVKGEYKGGSIREQALGIRTSKGVSVLTGCAHPGIVRMAGKVKGIFGVDDIYCAAGGFHLKASAPREVRAVIGRLEDMGARNFAPAHCTGDEAIGIFREEKGKRFLETGSGRVLEV